MVWRPVDLTQSNHAVPRGQHPCHLRPSLPGLPPGHRVVALGEVGGMTHPATHPSPAVVVLVAGIPEACPPGEGMVWSGRAAFADVAPFETTPTRALLAEMPVHPRRHRLMLVIVGGRWVMWFVPALCRGAARAGRSFSTLAPRQ